MSKLIGADPCPNLCGGVMESGSEYDSHEGLDCSVVEVIQALFAVGVKFVST
jgi:hypothetical protein